MKRREFLTSLAGVAALTQTLKANEQQLQVQGGGAEVPSGASASPEGRREQPVGGREGAAEVPVQGPHAEGVAAQSDPNPWSRCL